MIKLFNKMLNMSGKYKSRIIIAVVFSLIKSIASKMPICLAFFTLSKFYNNTLKSEDCIKIFIGMLMILIIEATAQYISDALQSGAGYNIFCDKRIDLGQHLRKLPMGYFNEGNIGKISSVISTDMIFIEEMAMSTIADNMGYIFSAAIMIVFMFYLNIFLGCAALLISVVVIIIGENMNKISLIKGAEKQEKSEKMTNAVLEFVQGISIIKSYNLLGKKSEELTNAFRNSRDHSLGFEKELTPWQRNLNIIYAFGITLIVGITVYLQQTGTISAPYLFGVILFVFDLFGPLKALYGESTRFTVMNSCIDRIDDLFNVKELPDNGEKHIPEKEKDNTEIEFENVTFGYTNKDIIKNISFKVKKNSMLALVGPSGGGKSTIANLLVRFWDIKEGAIKIRGRNISEVPLSELMDNVSMVFQRVYLFQDTIYNNISMGRKDASKEQVYEAAKKARCYDFIMSLPDKFDTVIGEGGATLSGGEKQRISIARCILKDAPIVVLDEATASVDIDNERYIQEAISELVKDKTLLVIAHRLNTIKNAEKIMVISDGKIADIGTHEELIKKKGIYGEYIKIRNEATGWSL